MIPEAIFLSINEDCSKNIDMLKQTVKMGDEARIRPEGLSCLKLSIKMRVDSKEVHNAIEAGVPTIKKRHTNTR